MQNTPFHFSIDHCFPIKGQGMVLIGTCLSGSLKVIKMVEFTTLSFKRKVKSMHMFCRKVNKIKQWDRVGIYVANLDHNLMERGVAASPGSVRGWWTVPCPIWSVARVVVRDASSVIPQSVWGGRVRYRRRPEKISWFWAILHRAWRSLHTPVRRIGSTVLKSWATFPQWLRRGICTGRSHLSLQKNETSGVAVSVEGVQLPLMLPDSS